MGQWPRRVLILYEGANQGGDLGLSFADGLRSHGCDVQLLHRNDRWEPAADLVLAYGPFERRTGMLAVARTLAAQPPGARPLFAWWLTESLPSPRMPAALVEVASRLRVAVDGWPVGRRADHWLARGHRLRIFGELRWVHSRGLLDVLAVTSASRAAYLQRRGFAPIVVPLGYHPAYYGEDLGLRRDIDVCFVGNVAAPRRRRLLAAVRDQLQRRGLALAVRDDLYGEARTRFLNRCRIMLNILRAPQDFVGQRFLLAAANKTLIVSEPVSDREPFEAGRHLVVAPLDRLGEAVVHYLSHEAERRAVVDEAHRLITRDLTVAQMTGRILARARRVAEMCQPQRGALEPPAAAGTAGCAGAQR